MRDRATTGARVAQRRAWLHVRRAAEAQDGFTLAEVLVVLAILGVVLGGIAQALHVCGDVPGRPDEPHASTAGGEARARQASPGDPLRERVSHRRAATRTGVAVTITLGSYCSTAGGRPTVTWCTKDTNGTEPPVDPALSLGRLWRYESVNCGSGNRVKWASGPRGRRRAWTGKIFDATLSRPHSCPRSSVTGAPCALAAGRIRASVTAVLSAAPSLRVPVPALEGDHHIPLTSNDHCQLQPLGLPGSSVVQRLRPDSSEARSAPERRPHAVRRHRAGHSSTRSLKTR